MAFIIYSLSSCLPLSLLDIPYLDEIVKAFVVSLKRNAVNSVVWLYLQG